MFFMRGWNNSEFINCHEKNLEFLVYRVEISTRAENLYIIIWSFSAQVEISTRYTKLKKKNAVIYEKFQLWLKYNSFKKNLEFKI